MTLVELRPGLHPGQVGHKFANLGEAAAVVAVPPAVCVPVRCHRAALDGATTAAVARIAADLRATRAFALPAALQDLQGLLLPVRVPTALRRPLVDAAARWAGAPLAVRSSAVGEDSVVASYAGIYDSVTDVRGARDLLRAVERCWFSYYSPRAITARLRHGVDVGTPGMAVIIQPMVEAVLAGVSIGRCGEAVTSEYVRGPGAALVSGAAGPIRAGDADRLVESEVAAVVSTLAEHWDTPIEVEWVWDGTAVRTVQVRPVSGGATTAPPSVPLCLVDLYSAPWPSGVELGSCRPVFDHFRAKRGWTREAAQRFGFDVGAAWVVNYTHRGLAERRCELARSVAGTPADQVVVDLSSAVRQVVLAKDELPEHLLTATPRDEGRHVALVRDFYGRGGGAVCALAADGERLVVEYSPQGLLALNRGVTGAAAFVLPTGLNALRTASPELARVWSRLYELTRHCDKEVPGIQLEWALDGDRAIFVDHSVPAAALGEEVSEDPSHVLSAGHASGPALVVKDGRLVDLSIGAAISVHAAAELEHRVVTDLLARVRRAGTPPVLVVDRPYAVLSVLLDHVAGFVFRQGSIFSHLAVLLRERGYAAVCSPLPVTTGDRVSLSNGVVRVDPAGTTRRHV